MPTQPCCRGTLRRRTRPHRVHARTGSIGADRRLRRRRGLRRQAEGDQGHAACAAAPRASAPRAAAPSRSAAPASPAPTRWCSTAASARATTSAWRCARAATPALHVRVPVGAVTGPISVVTAAGSASRPTLPLAILPPPPAGAQPGPEPGAGRPGGGRPRTRDRHQPHQGLRGRAARGHVLVPPVRRPAGLTQRRARARQRRRRGQELDAGPGRARRGAERVLGRAHRLQRGQAGPLLLPAHRGQRERRRGAQRADRQRRARRLRPLRPHVPDPRAPRLRRRERRLRLRARRALPPGPRRVRRVRHAAWWRRAAAR